MLGTLSVLDSSLMLRGGAGSQKFIYQHQLGLIPHSMVDSNMNYTRTGQSPESIGVLPEDRVLSPQPDSSPEVTRDGQ